MDVTQLDWLTGSFGPLDHEPPCHPDSRCTVCYTAEEISDAESFDETYDDDKREFEPREPRVDPQTGFLE